MSWQVRFRRRRNFFTKQWLQMRYMLLLAGGAVLGGFFYAIVLKKLLRARLVQLMYESHSLLPNTWEALYPVVMKATLILFVACVTILFVLIQVFSWRVNRAGCELEDLLKVMARGEEGKLKEGGIALKEFGVLAEKVQSLVNFYRNRWEGLTAEAGEISTVVDKLEEPEGHEERVELYLALDSRLEDLRERIRHFGEEGA